MGYSFTIGEGRFVRDVYGEDVWEHFVADSVHLDEAPVFDLDGMTGNGNSRHPSYSGWFDFCKDAGSQVFDLFYNTPRGHTGQGTLIPEHPGACVIEQKHLDAVDTAIYHRKKISNRPAGFRDDQDATLARLMWLEFWFRWALANCKNPMFINT